jgi:uncharacterized membrane protein YgdD (TMEM256/DUF423 family)
MNQIEMQKTASGIAAITGLCAISTGAFGAHGLEDLLAQKGTAALWEKAVFYHCITVLTVS